MTQNHQHLEDSQIKESYSEAVLRASHGSVYSDWDLIKLTAAA